jgi:lipid-binding SYLF domain-containing protein
MVRNYLVVFLIGVFVFASRASAQNCDCKQDCACQQQQGHCTCQQQGQCGYQQQQQPAKAQQCAPCAQRQKPYVEAPVPRTIAPRNLPLVYEKEAERANDAARVISDFPQQVFLEAVRAIAVIPSVKKGAFIFGARWGKGLMTKRDTNGCWLPPSFIEISGGNFGFQAGIEATDLVLVFTSEDAVNSILKRKLTLNADAAGAAGPYGRKAQIGMPMAAAGILTFMSKSRGAFAGISLDGAVITVDSTANQRVYGKGISGEEILVGRRVEVNDVVAPFLTALEKHSPSGQTASVQQKPVDQSAGTDE